MTPRYYCGDDDRPGFGAHDDPDGPWRYVEDCGCDLCLGWELETLWLESGAPAEDELMDDWQQCWVATHHAELQGV